MSPSDAASYHIVSIGSSGTKIEQYVIDTNVVSHIERLIRGGAPDVHTGKASDLFRLLSEHPDIAVIDDFAWIEGSSFHRAEGLSPTSIVIRDIAAQLLVHRPDDAPAHRLEDPSAHRPGDPPVQRPDNPPAHRPDDPPAHCRGDLPAHCPGDLLAAIADITGWRLPDDYEQQVRTSLDGALSAMVLTVVPCYLAALELERRYGGASASRLTVEDVIAVLTVLSDELNYVPGVLFAALTLACVGAPASRTAVMRVFKTGRRSKKTKEHAPVQNALSAAWDLGVLQLLSVKLAVGSHAALVTEDTALADLASAIEVTAGGGIRFRESALSETGEASSDFHRVQTAYSLLRAPATPAAPTRAVAARAARAIESALGVQSSLPDALEHGLDIAFPQLRFTDIELRAVCDVLRAENAQVRGQTLTTLLDADLLDADPRLQGRFDAAFSLSAAIVGVVSAARGITIERVLQPLAERDEHGFDVALALAAFARARDEPFTATVYRELLCRPSTIRVKLSSIVGGTFVVIEHWAPVLGLRPGELIDRAVAGVT